MGFLSAWDSTEKIDVSDLVGAEPMTWWVEVKKCLTHGEADAVMRELMASTMKFGDATSRGGIPVSTSLSVDAVVDHQAIIVAKSIVSWNLTDDFDVVLPIHPYEALIQSLEMLPAPVYDRVAEVVVAANTENKNDAAPFLVESGGSDSIGIDYTPNDREILV